MSHKAIGVATIKGNVTTIRKYDNGIYSVEVNGDVLYSSQSLKELINKLDENKIKHKIT